MSCKLFERVLSILTYQLTLQEEERKKREEEMAKNTVEMFQKRREYQEKTKNALVIDMPNESKSGRKGGRGRRDDYVSDSGGSGDEGGAPRESGSVNIICFSIIKLKVL